MQIGDPITEKRLAGRAARGRATAASTRAITDCGAGGLSSAVGEMASELGADVELARVPLKYPACAPGRSGSPRRRSAWSSPCPREHWTELQAIFAGGRGRGDGHRHFTGDGKLLIRYDGKIVADLDGAFLHDGMPQRAIAKPSGTRPRKRTTQARFPLTPTCNQLLERLLADPNVAIKEPIVRHYDHEVQGGRSASRSSAR